MPTFRIPETSAILKNVDCRLVAKVSSRSSTYWNHPPLPFCALPEAQRKLLFPWGGEGWVILQCSGNVFPIFGQNLALPSVLVYFDYAKLRMQICSYFGSGVSLCLFINCCPIILNNFTCVLSEVLIFKIPDVGFGKHSNSEILD